MTHPESALIAFTCFTGICVLIVIAAIVEGTA